ncbi:MAG: M15 family metallopeptidase [Bacteroidetes bacterium]|nr:M15 family metallopeptidase [Bacteroidota bacterium]
MRLLILFLLLAACSEPVAETSSSGAETQTLVKEQEETPQKQTVSESTVSFTADYVMGKFNPAKHPDFLEIPLKYADQAGRYMRKDAFEAFAEMHAAAKADGITLRIESAARNFEYQKGIWERKWTGARKVDGKDLSVAVPDPVERALKILEYSSMPGTSRHHWGTDIDINDFENAYFESGQGLQEYQWLQANASTFGYCQVYSEKGPDRPNGYNMEKWHWSYLPVARELTAFAERQIKDTDITGFKGAEAAAKIGVIEKYVLGIAPVCK